MNEERTIRSDVANTHAPPKADQYVCKECLKVYTDDDLYPFCSLKCWSLHYEHQ